MKNGQCPMCHSTEVYMTDYFDTLEAGVITCTSRQCKIAILRSIASILMFAQTADLQPCSQRVMKVWLS